MDKNTICSEPSPSAGCADEPHSLRAGCTDGLSKLPSTEREFESALRALGYSRKMAKSISRHGFKATKANDLTVASEELSAAVTNILAVLKT